MGAVNVMNLLLVRAQSAAREAAIRQALGASRGQVVVQAMVETVLLTLLGGVFGLAVGAGGIRLLVALGVDQLPLGSHVVFDGRLACLGLGGAIVAGLVLGLPVAWCNVRSRSSKDLQSGVRAGNLTPARQLWRHGFVVAQIALAFVLLAGAGLLGLSLQRVLAISPGFRPDHVITGRILLHRDEAARLGIVERLIDLL